MDLLHLSFRKTHSPTHRSSSHLRYHLFIFGFIIENTAFPHLSSTLISHWKPCRRVWGMRVRRDFCDYPTSVSRRCPSFIFLSSSQGANILRANMSGYWKRKQNIFPNTHNLQGIFYSRVSASHYCAEQTLPVYPHGPFHSGLLRHCGLWGWGHTGPLLCLFTKTWL